MREPEAVVAARCALGARLAACRRAVGLTQAQLAVKARVSRSFIANVETGRQHVQRDFWESADAAVSAGGSLVAAYDKLDQTARQARAGITQSASTPEPVTLPVVYATGRPLPRAVPDQRHQPRCPPHQMS